MAARTLATFSLKSTRTLSTHSWKGKVTLKPGDKQIVINDVYGFCAFTGLDNLGAAHATIASGGHHVNPNDKVDTFARATVLLCDAKGMPIELIGSDGRKYKRIHVPQDHAKWHRYQNYFQRTK